MSAIKKTPQPTHSGITSSAHLASKESMALSEFEFGLIIASNAFSRWVVRCLAAAGLPDLTYTDALVLHHINHRARGKKLADICFTLNYEDTHVVNYALKKLLVLKLVATEKQGKEVFYSTNVEGQSVIARYREVREQCLVQSVGTDHNQDIAALAGLLRKLSGQYDQAARAATSL
jgi:predicted MarR family transcription regulator